MHCPSGQSLSAAAGDSAAGPAPPTVRCACQPSWWSQLAGPRSAVHKPAVQALRHTPSPNRKVLARSAPWQWAERHASRSRTRKTLRDRGQHDQGRAASPCCDAKVKKDKGKIKNIQWKSADAYPVPQTLPMARSHEDEAAAQNREETGLPRCARRPAGFRTRYSGGVGRV